MAWLIVEGSPVAELNAVVSVHPNEGSWLREVGRMGNLQSVKQAKKILIY